MREPHQSDSAADVAYVIGEDDARSGVTGHNVRYVLAAGLALVISSFLVMSVFV